MYAGNKNTVQLIWLLVAKDPLLVYIRDVLNKVNLSVVFKVFFDIDFFLLNSKFL